MTHRRGPHPVIFVALCALSAVAAGADLVKQFSGRGDAHTAEFEVTAPWLLTWRISSDFPATLGFEMSLINANTRMHEGLVLRTKQTGNGYKLFNESGRFRFRINSSFANWHLRIEELSQQEADELIPTRQKNPLFR